MAILPTGSSGAVKSIIPTSTREITAVMLWQQCSRIIIWIGGLAFEISKIKALPPDSEFKLHQDISVSLHFSFSSIISISCLYPHSFFHAHPYTETPLQFLRPRTGPGACGPLTAQGRRWRPGSTVITWFMLLALAKRTKYHGGTKYHDHTKFHGGTTYDSWYCLIDLPFNCFHTSYLTTLFLTPLYLIALSLTPISFTPLYLIPLSLTATSLLHLYLSYTSFLTSISHASLSLTPLSLTPLSLSHPISHPYLSHPYVSQLYLTQLYIWRHNCNILSSVQYNV